MTTPSIADQLLDAQVAWTMAQLTGDRLAEQVTALVDEGWSLAASMPLGEAVTPAAIKPLVRRLLATVPASVGTSELVAAATDVVRAGPADSFLVGELTDRDQVEALVDAVLGQVDVVERALARLTDSPLVGMVATRFMGRIVGEVLQANRAVAEKVPGLGTLMSFGTGAASRVMGAADKQFEGLLGDATGKGASLAVRRLNKIVVETLRDPATREAVLQVWSQVEDARVVGVGEYLTDEELSHLVLAVQGVVATAAGTEHVAALADALVDSVFDRYAEHPATELLVDLGISRDDIVADLLAMAPSVIARADADGALTRAVRARIEPFFTSPEVAAILA